MASRLDSSQFFLQPRFSALNIFANLKLLIPACHGSQLTATAILKRHVLVAKVQRNGGRFDDAVPVLHLLNLDAVSESSISKCIALETGLH
jgi:hypothetical protein